MTRRNSIAILLGILLSYGIEAYAQTEFRKAKLVFSNGKALTVEVADTAETRQQGLMGRMRLGENEAMLFVFPRESRMRFWMRDTYIPLSIAFFDKDKRLMSILKMKPQMLVAATQDLSYYESEIPGLFALEVNQGWFEKHKIQKGMTFELRGLE